MTREILFRGKVWGTDGQQLDFVYGYLCGDSFIKDKKGIEHVVIPETVGQYSSINSKISKKNPDGVKIFEGDIVKFYKSTSNYTVSITAKVIFERGSFYAYWEREMLGEIEIHKDLLTKYDSRYLRVIGNIHDKK